MHASTRLAIPQAAAAPAARGTRFTLGPSITPEQKAHLDTYGFLIFSRVASGDEVGRICDELDRVNRLWLSEGKKRVYGIPLFVGRGASGEPLIQRSPFTSMYSDYIRSFVHDARFNPIRGLIGAETRVGEREKDGVVINRYINVPGSVYPRLGWHTDGLRDLFYFRKPKQMLNVGLHFDRISAEDGGLRLIPGTHKQGMASFLFKKPYFVSHAPDPDEIAVETEVGDLTVHDGRLWHRVQQSPHTGARSLRRSMYVPYLTDAYAPKDEDAPTPLYHYLGMLQRKLRRPLR
jgi:phytanoyl-CoA hydroxylase